MLLSIIIPIYKTEPYIKQCLLSISASNADSASFEIIVVNDGTPDNSMLVVNEFARKYPNIHIINQENQGLSCARNAGLEIAKGKYVWFVDSDDSLTDNGLTQVIEILNDTDADILGFDMVMVRERDNSCQLLPITNYPDLYGKALGKEDIMGKIQVAPSQRFVFRREFLSLYNLEFYPGIIHEDMEFDVKAFYFAANIRLMRISAYRYLRREAGNILSSLDMRSVKSKFLIIKSFENYCHLYAQNSKDCIYWNRNIFVMLCSIFTFHDRESADFKRFVRRHVALLRKAALKGVIANLFLWEFKDLIKAVLAVIDPDLLKKCFKIKIYK